MRMAQYEKKLNEWIYAKEYKGASRSCSLAHLFEGVDNLRNGMVVELEQSRAFVSDKMLTIELRNVFNPNFLSEPIDVFNARAPRTEGFGLRSAKAPWEEVNLGEHRGHNECGRPKVTLQHRFTSIFLEMLRYYAIP